MLENRFQANLIKELKKLYPDCIITKLDSSHIQGIPDLLVLYNDKWCCLECKKSETSRHRPNQDYYIDRLNNMGFARFVYPENKNDVLQELRKYLD